MESILIRPVGTTLWHISTDQAWRYGSNEALGPSYMPTSEATRQQSCWNIDRKCNAVHDYRQRSCTNDPRSYEFALRDSGQEPICDDCLLVERLSGNQGALRVEDIWRRISGDDRAVWLGEHGFVKVEE